MRALFYSGVALVLVAVLMAASSVGARSEVIALLDWLFVRGAVIVFLYLLWRFVRAYESQRNSPQPMSNDE